MDAPRALSPAPQHPPCKSDVSSSSLEGVTVRPGESTDLKELKCCHEETLVVDYPDDFYFKATHGCEGIVGWVADISTGDDGKGRKMVGFVTVQLQDASDNRVAEEGLVECRHMLNFWSFEKRKLVYILTMGVLPKYRQGGIATALLNTVKTYSKHGLYSQIYLHALAGNAAAIQFYTVSEQNLLQPSPSPLPTPHPTHT